jgi:hypothetical protein
MVRMISVTVHYGNHNKYVIGLPNNTQLGNLSTLLTSLIDRRPEDVLYIVMCGHLVGSEKMNYSSTLADCDIVGDRCVASIVFRDPSITYPESDLCLNSRNMMWIRQRTPSTTSAAGTNDFASALLNAMGLTTQMTDVPVVISESEYHRYITQVDEPPTDPCSICTDMIGETGVSLGCGHCFHDECIREVLTTSSVKCPNCNYDVRNGDLV